MAANAPTLIEVLDAAGYARSALGADIIWKLSTPELDTAIRARVEILERKGQFHITKCVIQINHEKTLELITARAKKRFGRVTSSSGSVEPDGRMRCVIEIAPAKTDERARRGVLTGGVGTTIGWTTSITHTDNMISAQMTDAFLIGDTIPNWWADVLSTVSEAITPHNESSWEARHLQELVIPVSAIPIHSPRNIAKLKRAALAGLGAIELPISLRTTISEDRTIIESAPASSIMAIETPIEILEARETSGQWRALDIKIRQRKASRLSITDPDAGDLDTFSRLGAFPNLNTVAVNARLENSLGNMWQASLLALTGATVIAGTMKRDKDLVHLISDILRKVTAAYGPLDSIRPLSQVAPEVLGDCWAKISPDMAFKSWAASMTTQRQNPRIQHKIAELARKTDDYLVEFNALMTLALNERRREGLEIVAPRLIKLADDHPDLTASVKSTYLIALDHMAGVLPNNKQVIMAIVRSLTAKGEHRRALTTLESCLTSSRVTLSNSDVADLNAAMGGIWHRNERNITLATARFVVATTAPAEPSDEIFSAAETFFSETNNSTQLRRVLRVRSEQSNGSSSIDALERSARYLADQNLYSDALHDITRLLASGRARQWYLDIIEGAAGDDEVNWSEVARTMREANVSELPRDSIGAWKLIAGRVAQRVTNSSQSDDFWLETLTNLQVIPLLSDHDSRQIRTTLIKRHDYHRVASFTSSRLAFAKKDEYTELVREIVSTNLTLDDGLFEQAIAEHAANTASTDLSIERANRLIADRRIKDLRALRQAHISFLAGSTLLTAFLDSLLRLVTLSGDITLAETLEEIFEDKVAQGDLSAEEEAAWTNLFLEHGFLKLSERRLRRDIENGLLSVKNEDLVSALFIDDPGTMAKWHYLARATQKPGAKYLHHAAEATRLWLTTNDRPSEMIETLTDLASNSILEDGPLELLERLCVREKKIEHFIAAIDRQVTLRKKSDTEKLSHWGIRVIMSHALDPLLAAKYYSKWLVNGPEHFIYDSFALGRLYYAGDDIVTAQKHLISILSVPEILGEPEVLVSAAVLLTKCKPDRILFATVIQTLISWSRSAHNNELTDMMVQHSITWHIAGIDDLNREFITKFAHEDLERLADIATQILAKADRLANGVQKTIAEWQETFTIASNRGKWWDVIRLMTRDKLLGQLRRSARCDLLHIHARNLFENDASRLDAIPFYEAIASENPMDSRVWLPLYSLYEESGSRQQLIDHLDRIIPLLQRDGVILEKTPFNIESLKNSLRRVRETSVPGQGHLAARPTTPLADHNFQDRASQMQQAWINSIPAVRITAMASGDFSNHAPAGTREPQTAEPSQEFDLGRFNGSAAQNLAVGIYTGNGPAYLEVVNSKANEISESRHEPKQATPHSEDARERIDWRDMVLNEKISVGITERIMTMAFANETEKHVAVQCAALLNAETKVLDAWHWPVWRNSGSYDYPLSPSGRLFADESMKIYGGPLHTLLRMIAPIIVRSRQHKFLIQSRLASLGIHNGVTFTRVTMDHPAIIRGGLRYFKSILDGAKATFCDTTGLGAEVFFDLQTRIIHFDAKWQMSLPPGVLTYRVLEYLTNFQKGHIGIIDLDAEVDIRPLLEEIKEVLASSGISRLRIAFGMQHRDINDQLKSVNREQLVSLLTMSGSPSIFEIRRLQTEIRMKSLTTILASSLDVIGILESLTGKDLCDANLLTPKRVFEIHPLARALLFAAAKLIL